MSTPLSSYTPSSSSSSEARGGLLSKHLHPLPSCCCDSSDQSKKKEQTTFNFGRIVEGIDLSAQSSLSKNSELQNEIVSALYEHGLLVFRNQSHLSPSDELAFAKLFTHQETEDDTTESYTGGAGTQHRLPDYPSIALVGTYSVHDYYGLTASSSGVYNNWHTNQRAWHCDGLADTHPPPDLTTMRCIKTPACGGETLFASSAKAAELLPTEMLIKKFGIHPEDVTVHYKLFNKYKIALEGTHLEYAEGTKGKTVEGGWDVNIADGTSVPLVIRERNTGKRSLVGTYHVSSITTSQEQSLDFEKANAYLAEAWRPGLSEENVYKHKWKVGDLAAWSNRLVIHTATSTKAYEGQERLHTRIRMRSREEDAPKAWKEVS